MTNETSQKVVLVSTIVYFFIELYGGIHYHSLALVTDASFMAINITGQFIALYIGRLARRRPNRTKTFGYERAKVLSGLFNGMLVGFLLFYVFSDAYHKILNPEPVEAFKVLVIAVIGLGVNFFGLVMLYKYSSDINIKGAVMLLLNDTLGSVGVILSSIIITYTGLYFVDPLTGVLIGLTVAYPTYTLIKDSVHILMEGNPTNIDAREVEGYIYKYFPEVVEAKDIHIWGLSTETILTALRIRTREMDSQRKTIKKLKEALKARYGFYDVYVESYESKKLLKR